VAKVSRYLLEGTVRTVGAKFEEDTSPVYVRKVEVKLSKDNIGKL
jgi:hypothetical protein